MRTIEFRLALADPLFHMDEANFKNMVGTLAADPRIAALGLSTGRGTAYPTLTPSGCAVLVLAGAFGRRHVDMPTLVMRRWDAGALAPCPKTGESTFGPALTRCLEDPPLARRLGIVEVALDFGAGKLCWRDGTETEFMQGSDAHEWRKRYATANSPFGIGTLRLALIPGPAIAWLATRLPEDASARKQLAAALIEADQAGEQNPQ